MYIVSCLSDFDKGLELTKFSSAVYGAKGRLNESFVVSTKAALKNIAQVTEELNTHFHLNISETSVGMSRLAAYLHLLNHQVCINSLLRLQTFLTWTSVSYSQRDLSSSACSKSSSPVRAPHYYASVIPEVCDG